MSGNIITNNESILFNSLFETTVQAMIVINSTGIIVECNPATCKIFGYDKSELLGNKINILMPARFAKHHDGYIKNYEETGESKIIGKGREVEALHKNGTVLQISLSVSHSIIDGSNYYIGLLHDLTELKQLAYSDSLTSLPNRRGILEDLSRSITNSRSGKSKYFAVMLLDIDKFKRINDSLGHQSGDGLLKIITEKIIHLLRRTDIVKSPGQFNVGRQGGDEFMIILKDMTCKDNAEIVADRLLKHISTPIKIDNMQVSVTCSIGITFFSLDDYITHNTDLEEFINHLLKQADSALYQSKQKGRNCYTILNPKPVTI